MCALKPHLVVSPRAQQDIRSIRLYGLTHWGPPQTDAYLAHLTKGISRLTDHPLIGKSRDDLAQGVRCWMVERHVVYYRTTANQIDIIRILHERVDPSRQAFG